MSLDPDDFRALLGRFASGVTVVTTVDAQARDVGMTVSAFCSVSLDPPLVLVCIAKDATAYRAFETTPTLAINVLAESQEALSRRFAGAVADRFDGIGYGRAKNGAAILHDVLAWMEGAIDARHEAGDHLILLVRVTHGAVADHRPLLYYRGGYGQIDR